MYEIGQIQYKYHSPTLTACLDNSNHTKQHQKDRPLKKLKHKTLYYKQFKHENHWHKHKTHWLSFKNRQKNDQLGFSKKTEKFEISSFYKHENTQPIQRKTQ